MLLPRHTVILLFATLLTAACGGTYRQVSNDDPGDPGLPRLVVSQRDTVLRSGHPQRVRLGKPRSGLPLEIVRSSIDGQEVLVRVHGGIELTGVVKRDELAVLVCQPGLLGTRGYVGKGNAVSLRSRVQDGQVQVSAQVVIAEREHVPGKAYHLQFQQRSLAGSVSVDRLCTQVPGPRHAGTDADPHLARADGEIDDEDFPPGTAIIDMPKDVTLTLLDRPGGAEIHTRPAGRWGYELARLQHQGEWDLVALGGGPYLVGWTRARPVRSKELTGGLGMIGGILGGSAQNGPFALHIGALAKLPLHSLPEGTVIQQFGEPIARLTKPGFGRVGVLRDGWVYVVAAVDNDVVVEGWINPAALGPKLP